MSTPSKRGKAALQARPTTSRGSRINAWIASQIEEDNKRAGRRPDLPSPMGNRETVATGANRSHNERPAVASKYERGMLASEQAASTALMSNAVAYVRAQYDPFNSPPARIPDPLNFPTALCTSSKDVTMSGKLATSGSDGIYRAMLAWIPSLAGKVRQCLTYVISSGNALVNSETSLDDPLFGASVANWAMYRTTAMAVRFKNLTPVLQRGGIIRYLQLPVWYGSSPGMLNGMNFNFLNNNVYASKYDFADPELESHECAYHPLTYSSDLDFRPATSSSVDYDPPILMIIESEEPFEVNAEVTSHYEYAPLIAFSQFVNPMICPGSPGDLAKVEAEVSMATSESSSHARFADTAKAVLRQLGSKYIKPLLVKGASFVSSLLSTEEHTQAHLAWIRAGCPQPVPDQLVHPVYHRALAQARQKEEEMLRRQATGPPTSSGGSDFHHVAPPTLADYQGARQTTGGPSNTPRAW